MNQPFAQQTMRLRLLAEAAAEEIGDFKSDDAAAARCRSLSKLRRI